MFPKAVVPFYNLLNSAQRFQFLYILPYTCYFLFLVFLFIEASLIAVKFYNSDLLTLSQISLNFHVF